MILKADARHIPLAYKSVHCCITSPPYWGLRDYGLGEKGIGLERTIEEYVGNIVVAFREVKRVMRDDGTLWLVIGDSYTSGNRKTRDPGRSTRHPAFAGGNYREGLRPGTPLGLKPKDLCGIPWRVAFALQADGWWLRQDIVWSKDSPMPESVQDRCTRSHEYVFLLSKSKSYFYDAEAIAEPLERPEESKRAMPARFGGADKFLEASKQSRLHSGREYRGTPNGMRNRRSVWRINAEPFRGAHYAVFPSELVRLCLAAGTSQKGCCPECGKPWKRIVKKTTESAQSNKGSRFDLGKTGVNGNGRVQPGERFASVSTGWKPQCSHRHDPIPCIAFDPFCGSGTVGEVAFNMGRRFVISDLSYQDLAIERVPPMYRFGMVAV